MQRERADLDYLRRSAALNHCQENPENVFDPEQLKPSGRRCLTRPFLWIKICIPMKTAKRPFVGWGPWPIFCRSTSIPLPGRHPGGTH
ncbi:hypothetical protein NON20_21520 [Synechocystis sp. B12]|nr:hypothetical protein NON20_21520 [Synechocystis sp. B12]